MQMQTNKKTVKPAKQFKLGDTVTWKSQAGGLKSSKTGKIVAIIGPNKTLGYYAVFDSFSKDALVSILRETRDMTRDEAREYLKRDHYFNWKSLLVQEKYKLKFNVGEGFDRADYHYLVEVDRGPTKKAFLYHPRTRYLKDFRIVKK